MLGPSRGGPYPPGVFGLALLFIVLPAVELGLLIQVGSLLGVFPTIGLIILTGIVGAALAKRQGLETLQKIQQATAQGEMPVGQLVDGALILFAGALLVTPGILTDVAGFLCLVPGTRQVIKRQLQAALRRYAESGHVRVVTFHGPAGPGGGPAPGPGVEFGRPPAGPRGRGPVIDVEPEPSRAEPSPEDEREASSESGDRRHPELTRPRDGTRD